MADEAVGKVPLQLLRGRIVASIQLDLSGAVLRQFQTDLLTFVQASAATGVVLDVSGVEVMDAEEFNALRRAMSMVEVMGARPVLVGLRPGVVSALVDLGVDPGDMAAALSIDDGLSYLDSLMPQELGGAEDEGELEATDEEWMVMAERQPETAESEEKGESEHDPRSYQE
jgi:rsbT antagonist protein RsbS